MGTITSHRLRLRHRGLVVAGALLGALHLPAPPVLAAPSPVFKLLLENPGVYRVGFDDLPWKRRPADPQPSAAVGLAHRGRPVPIWVEDGGDGAFGPGDWIEFVGEHLAGDSSYFSPYTRYNAYLLGFDWQRPARMRVTGSAPGGSVEVSRARPRAVRHLEKDLLMLRLPPRPGGEDELWYWAKLAHNQDEPFTWTLDTGDLDASPGASLLLRVGLRGWSRPRRKPDPETPDHAVEISLNGTPVASARWNGTGSHVVEVPELPAERLRRGGNDLALRVPARPGENGALIDVVMLNWIEIDYPRTLDLGSGQVSFELRGPSGGAEVELTSAAGERPWTYGRNGSRIPPRRGTGGGGELTSTWKVGLPPGESSFIAATASALRSPVRIDRYRSAGLAATDRGADYLIVTDSRFRTAIERLAELHRGRGLRVVVADFEEVVDEFGHGVVHPKALRDFIAHAFHSWRRPAPRFVLLVGDASWDGRNELVVDTNYADWPYRFGEIDSFPKNTSTPYGEDADRNRRGLIPTWSQPTMHGHAASDNPFVAVDGDDALPDLAIGRLPVVTPEEVEQIVAKTARYISSPEVGPWRRSALFITNDDRGFQGLSDRLAGGLAVAGFAAERVYPDAAEETNEHHTRRLVESFSRGQLVVHFLGHGGRYIWRTGYPDLAKNHDLFTLDHVDEIEPSGRLPVVLSLTCFSAPFDHPNADSIGEKLLRAADRGAVGVLAASWRNAPAPSWGRILLEELTAPGATIGEAVLAAKRRIGSRIFVDTYNLLGDPAVPVALPAGRIELEVGAEGAEGLRVGGTIGLDDFTGELLVELVDGGGRTLRSARLRPGSADFALEIPASPAELAGAAAVRAYAWDSARGVDAIGGLELASVAQRGEATAEDPASGAGSPE